MLKGQLLQKTSSDNLFNTVSTSGHYNTTILPDL